jgi:4-amino-4-deoxy-L-arabinose transferase-like glycosyltransferase
VNHRRWLVTIVAVGFIARLVWMLYAKGSPPVGPLQQGDQYSYWYYGNEIAKGHGYVSYVTGTPSAYYPVGFPLILAVLYWLGNHIPITDDQMLLAGLLHVAVSTATVYCVYVIGRRLLSPTAGLVAAGVLAVWPNAIYQVASLQVETMFVFLATAALAIIVDHDWSSGLPSRNRLLTFGFVLGVSCLVRPFSVWFLVGLLWAALAIGVGWRKAILATLVPAAVVAGLHVPWIIRNEIQMHAFIPTSTNTGDTLCLDRNMTAQGGFRFADHDGCVDPYLPEVPRNNGNTRKAIEFVLHHPAREALQIVRRGRLEFRSDHDGLYAVQTLGGGPAIGSPNSDRLELIADWYFYVVGIVSIVGLVVVARRGAIGARQNVLVAFIALFVIPLLLWGNERFHFPLVPFMAVFVAAAVEAARSSYARRHARRGTDDLPVVGVRA